MSRVEASLEFIGRLSRAADVGRAADLFEQAVEPFGVRTYSTWVLANPERFHPSLGLVSNWPAEWTKAYLDTRGYLVDPVVANALAFPGGFHWRDLRLSASASAHELFRNARQFGLGDGFSLPQPRLGRGPPTIVNVSGAHTFDWSEMEQGVVSLAAGAFMGRLLFLRDTALAPAVRALSPRERDILYRAAVGRPDKVIAHQLGLSVRTVQSYWRVLRRKLGAADRAHAVAIAIWSGQIAP